MIYIVKMSTLNIDSSCCEFRAGLFIFSTPNLRRHVKQNASPSTSSVTIRAPLISSTACYRWYTELKIISVDLLNLNKPT